MTNGLTGNFLIDSGMQKQVATPVSGYKSIVPDNNAKIKAISGVQNTADQTEQNIYSQEEFTGDVKKIMDTKSVDYDTAYNSTKDYYTSKGYTVRGFEDEFKPQEIEAPTEEISGLDIGVKFGQGASEIAKGFKFQSNIDDGIIESGLKFLGNLPANSVQIAGDIISLVSDPLGTVDSVKTLAKAGVESGLNKLFLEEGEEVFTSEEVEQVSDVVGQEFDKLGEPGRIKELLIENPADVLLAVTGGLGVAKNVAKAKGLTGLVSKLETAEKLTNPIRIQAEALKGIGKGISKTGEIAAQGVVKTTGLNFDTIKTIVKQPELFKQAETGTLTRQTVADKVVNAVNTKADEISDLGSEYKGIRELKSNMMAEDIGDLKGRINATLDSKNIAIKEGKLDFSNSNVGDSKSKKIIQDAYDLVHNRTKFDEGNDLLNLRQAIDDTINYKSDVSSKGEAVVKLIRGEVDTIAKEKLTGLKELDTKFGPERAEFDKLKKMIYDKDGSLKDNYISTVSNITGKGKELKLERLEKIAPDLSKQVKALKAFEDVELAKGTKVGTYMNAGSVGVGAIAGGIPGAVAAYIITHPTTLVNVLKVYTGSQAVINSIVTKVKNGVKLTASESKVVGSAIKEQALEKGSALTDGLADKIPGVKNKFMADTGKSLDDFGDTTDLVTEAKKYKSADGIYDTKSTLKDGTEVKFRYESGEQGDRIYGIYNDKGEYMGSASAYKDNGKLLFEDLDVENKFKKKGVMTELLDYIQYDLKTDNIDFGAFQTKEGKAFINKYKKVGTTKSATDLVTEAKKYKSADELDIPSYLRLYKTDINKLNKATDSKEILKIVDDLGVEGQNNVFYDYPNLKNKYNEAKKAISISNTPMNRAKTGQPIEETLYHGTDSKFDKIDSSFSNKSSGTGVGEGHTFYTDTKDVAKSYGSNIKETKVKLENPLVIDAKGGNWNDIKYKGESKNINDIAKIAEKEGYDGLIVKSIRDTGIVGNKPGGFTESTSVAVFNKTPELK